MPTDSLEHVLKMVNLISALKLIGNNKEESLNVHFWWKKCLEEPSLLMTATQVALMKAFESIVLLSLANAKASNRNLLVIIIRVTVERWWKLIS